MTQVRLDQLVDGVDGGQVSQRRQREHLARQVRVQVARHDVVQLRIRLAHPHLGEQPVVWAVVGRPDGASGVQPDGDRHEARVAPHVQHARGTHQVARVLALVRDVLVESLQLRVRHDV